MTVLLSVLAIPGTDIFLPAAAEGPEESFLENWLFFTGETNGEDAECDDSAWERVNIPHDWSIHMNFTAEAEAESGFLPGGTGWYRKHFTLEKQTEGKRVFVFFDGVYMNSSVYLNGILLGSHPYGYTAFGYDLTDYVIWGKENVLAVKVENILPNSRWYSGSGILRSVSLRTSGPVHFGYDGIGILAPDLEREMNGDVRTELSVSLENSSNEAKEAVVTYSIRDKDGNPVSETASQSYHLTAGAAVLKEIGVTVARPSLWSPDDPALYTLSAAVYSDGVLQDSREIAFGYRFFHFDSETGFSLNGEPLKLQGVCLHHDQGALGGVSDRKALARQLDLLKDMGANAIRSTHNPASKELLELCDEKGFLLIEEAFDTWANSKNYNWNDYGSCFLATVDPDNHILGATPGMSWAEYDVKAMVRSGRNHPSVILWSIGNEILGNIGGDVSSYPHYAEQLCGWIRSLDKERPVTIGDNMTGKEDPVAAAVDEVLMSNEGVIGFNYANGAEYDRKHELYPDWPLYGSESASALSSRGKYDTYGIDSRTYEITSYDTVCVEWGAQAQDAWMDVITRDFVAGEFIWTGFDYLGEPEPWNGLGSGSVTGGLPVPRSSYFGVIDTAGFVKDTYYYYRSQWNQNDITLHMVPVWDRQVLQAADGEVIPVVVYTNAASAELFLNGVSQGRKYFETMTTPVGYQYALCEGETALLWNVAFEEGELAVLAYDEKGNILEDTVGRSRSMETGSASYLRLESRDQTLEADGSDLAYVEITLCDENGNEVYDDDRLLTVQVSEKAVIVGTDNGSPTDLSSFQTLERMTSHGRALVILRSTKEAGEITLEVSADGLPIEIMMMESLHPVLSESIVAEESLPETEQEEVHMLEYLRNNWFVLLIYGVFLVLLAGVIYNRVKRLRREGLKKKNENDVYLRQKR